MEKVGIFNQKLEIELTIEFYIFELVWVPISA